MRNLGATALAAAFSPLCVLLAYALSSGVSGLVVFADFVLFGVISVLFWLPKFAAYKRLMGIYMAASVLTFAVVLVYAMLLVQNYNSPW